MKQVGGDWKRVSCHGNKMCYSHVDVFSVELLAYQASMICAANWQR